MKAALRTRGASPVARRHPAAWCALELACFDLWARCRERPLWRLFAERKVNRPTRYSTVIPYVEDNDRLQELLQLAKGLQTPSLKLKVVDIDSAIEQLRLVRRVLGPRTDVRVDANAAFSVKQALVFIKAVAPLALSAIEQPVARDDLTGLQLVAIRSPIPILADESMYTAKGVEYLIENKICHGLNVRLSSCGGLQNCLTIWPRARAQGMICQIGSHVGETAILALAGRHLAVISHDCAYLEGSFSKFVLAEDIVEEDITFGRLGHAPLPDGNGLGIRPRQALILKYGRLFGEYLPA
jgi:L-alanine-DL-glutamate epimerase-like enolase superfamily enzyme